MPDVMSKVVPFGSELRLVVANGTVIRAMLEHSVELNEPQGSFLIPSGMRFWWNPYANPLARVTRVEVRRRCQIAHAALRTGWNGRRGAVLQRWTWQVLQYPMNPGSDAWRPLEDGREYKMAVLDFILEGGDGYAMVQAGSRYRMVVSALASSSHSRTSVLVNCAGGSIRTGQHLRSCEACETA
jgi:hypothetical protein